MNWRWLMRAAMWARNPPSAQQAKWLAILVAVCIGIGLIEYFGYWPEWAKLDRRPRIPKL